ncbi:PTS sugar transporter subunit IIA, partial [Klebsiella pneumoniae]|nr:PTS sugar transporter subunit IIA [Klebsiella pneumoniae]
MSAISGWLNESKVQFVSSVSDWKSAIELAGRPLLNEGAISQSYIDAIIQQKEATGPYFVIAPGIAMPHARPEQGAVSLGLSVLKIGEPVNF